MPREADSQTVPEMSKSQNQKWKVRIWQCFQIWCKKKRKRLAVARIQKQKNWQNMIKQNLGTGLFQTYCGANFRSLQYNEYHEKSSHKHFFFWFPVNIKACLCYNVVYQACNSIMSKKSINHNFKKYFIGKNANHHLSLQ